MRDLSAQQKGMFRERLHETEAADGTEQKPSPAWRGWTGEAGPGVEGTPESPGQAPMNKPPPEDAFPHGEGGRAQP